MLTTASCLKPTHNFLFYLYKRHMYVGKPLTPQWEIFSRHNDYLMAYYVCVRIMTCSAIWGLLDKDDDLRAGHELWNTERIS